MEKNIKKERITMTRNISKTAIKDKILQIINILDSIKNLKNKNPSQINQHIIGMQKAIGLLYIKYNFLHKNNYADDKDLKICSKEYIEFHKSFIKKFNSCDAKFDKNNVVDKVFEEAFKKIQKLKVRHTNTNLLDIKYQTINHYVTYKKAQSNAKNNQQNSTLRKMVFDNHHNDDLIDRSKLPIIQNLSKRRHDEHRDRYLSFGLPPKITKVDFDKIEELAASSRLVVNFKNIDELAQSSNRNSQI